MVPVRRAAAMTRSQRRRRRQRRRPPTSARRAASRGGPGGEPARGRHGDGAMGLILPMVFLGLMASLSPATIVVFVLVLGTARASVNSLGFLIGWGLSLTLVFIGSYALARSGASESEGGRTTVAVMQ